MLCYDQRNLVQEWSWLNLYSPCAKADTNTTSSELGVHDQSDQYNRVTPEQHLQTVMKADFFDRMSLV